MLGKLFGFNPKETTVRTEIMAGITTFLTMAYILAVNPNILGETGMDKGALFTTTVLMSALPTIFMALYAKLPLALAPGMGLNAFFALHIDTALPDHFIRSQLLIGSRGDFCRGKALTISR